jgi:hypothetical protein
MAPMLRRMAKRSIVVAGLLSLVLLAPSSVAAHVVEVTTSLSLEQVQDRAQLKEALKAEVDRVISTAIAFKPTMVALTDARRVGERLMVRLLIADEEGEKLIEALERDGNAETSSRAIRL